MQPKVSVIVPIYNVEPYLRKCLDSLVNQTMKELEFILVDDGSPDNCGNICDEYALKDSRIQVIHKQNGGLSAARNDGLKYATGEYIAFVDSDDWCELDMYENAYRKAKEYDADIIVFDAFEDRGSSIYTRQYCDREFFTDKPEEIQLMQLSVLTLSVPVRYGFSFAVTQGSPWDKLYRKELFAHEDMRFPTGVKAHEDVIFNLYAYAYAKRVAYFPKAYYHYRILSNSIMRKYNPNRVEVDRKIAEEFETFASLHETHPDFSLAVRARIMNMFNQCGYRYFFNKENPNGFFKRLRVVKKALSEPPYGIVFESDETSYLNRKQQLVLKLGRKKMVFLIWLMNPLDSFLKKCKRR